MKIMKVYGLFVHEEYENSILLQLFKTEELAVAEKSLMEKMSDDPFTFYVIKELEVRNEKREIRYPQKGGIERARKILEKGRRKEVRPGKAKNGSSSV